MKAYYQYSSKKCSASARNFAEIKALTKYTWNSKFIQAPDGFEICYFCRDFKSFWYSKSPTRHDNINIDFYVISFKINHGNTYYNVAELKSEANF